MPGVLNNENGWGTGHSQRNNLPRTVTEKHEWMLRSKPQIQLANQAVRG